MKDRVNLIPVFVNRVTLIHLNLSQTTAQGHLTSKLCGSIKCPYIPGPWKVIGNLKESLKLNWNYQRDFGFQTKTKLLWGGGGGRVWVFPGTTH